MTTAALPPVTPDLVRLIAMRIADIKIDDWKKMAVDERRRHLTLAKKALVAERSYFGKRATPKQGQAAAPGSGRAKK